MSDRNRRNGAYEYNDEQSQPADEGAGWAAAAVGTILLGVGGYLISKGLTQRQTSKDSYDYTQGAQTQTTRVEERVTVNRSAADLYHHWRHLSNLADIMSHLESVTEKTDTRSHWVVKGPLGTDVEWDADITQDIQNQHIAWRAVRDADVQNEGSVTFTEAAGGRGTEVQVTLNYQPPGGKLGETVAKLFGEEPSQQLSDDLRRFKQRMETGVTQR